jgi:iron complex outermembrane receptor protein
MRRTVPLPTVGLPLLAAIAFSPLLRGEELGGAAGPLEQVLVTASRVEEEALKLPLAWSALDARALEFIAPVHISELMPRVPGVWITRGNGQESLPSLRSPVFTGAGSCGAFFAAADGISLRAPGFCNVNQLFDANTEQAGRVEVIRGPATALYGSDAMHGVINILSAPPSKVTDHRLALEAGPWDYYRAKYHYGNTSGAHGISLSVNGTSDGGYKESSGYDQQKLTLRHDFHGRQWDLTSVLDAANLNQETAGYVEGYKAYENSHLKRSNPNPEAFRDAWSVRFYSRASRVLDDYNTLTITPYLRDNDMTLLMHFVPWQPVEENGHSSLGVRAAVHTDTAQWHWVNGIEGEYTDGWLKESQEGDFSPNQPAGVHYDYQVDAVTAAAFSQATFSLQDRWELSAGLRLEQTRYDYDNRTADGPACAPEASACRFYRPADREDDFSNWSFNAGASYSLSDEHMAYLRLARGFRAPQVAELYRLQAGQEVADLDSEEIGSLEVGMRGFLNDSLQYELALYHMEKENVIFLDAERHNVSGAKTKHDGLELSVDYSFAGQWYLGLNGSFARHRYDSRAMLLGVTGDIRGNDIDTAPRAIGGARLGRDFSLPSAGAGRAELEWVYLGSHYLDPENEHKYGGYSLLNLRLTSALGRRWQGALRLTNLLDEDYAERADYAFGEYRYFVGQPRALYVELGYRFGAPD